MADILLAADLENEMEAMAEGGDGDEDVYADDDDEVIVSVGRSTPMGTRNNLIYYNYFL